MFDPSAGAMDTRAMRSRHLDNQITPPFLRLIGVTLLVATRLASMTAKQG